MPAGHLNTMLRARGRRLAGPALLATLADLLRHSDRRLGVAVLYHRVGDPPGDPRSELVPALGTELFASQLRLLERRFELVHASRLLTAARSRRRGQRLPAAVTFDDDLRSHHDVALPLLTAAGVPATFFLCGASLDGPHAFWWERLQRAFGGPQTERLLLAAGAPQATIADIHAAGRWLEALHPAARDGVSDALLRVAGPDRATTGVRRDGVRALRAAGMEIGFHTVRHDSLPALDEHELEHAMRAGRRELEAEAGPVTAFAYPSGHHDDRIARAAREHFSCAFTIGPRAVSATDDPFTLGRVQASPSSSGELAYALTKALASRIRDR